MTMKQLGSVTTMSAKDQPSVTSVLPTESGALTPLSSEKKTKAVDKIARGKRPTASGQEPSFFSGIVDRISSD